MASSDEVKHEYGLSLGVVDADNPVDVIVVAVGHNDYRNKSLPELRAICRGSKPILVDVKSLYDRVSADAAGFTVFRL